MEKKIPEVTKVKNQASAEIQITAEQLLREAKERDLEIVPPPPKQKISDTQELGDYQRRKRQTFEDNIRKNRMAISNWIEYAQWEESRKEVQRARSIFERALDVNHRNINLWLKYAEMEMRNRQVNHARNIWDRAITILPRANQFWYKYTYMEEMVGNVAAARAVFERWMKLQPKEQVWLTYVKFELRNKELHRARDIYSRFITVHAVVKNWIKYARFEESHGFISGARKVYERAVEFFGRLHLDEVLYVAFAKFEERQKEYKKARNIFKHGLDNIPKADAQHLYKAYTVYVKKYGDKSTVGNKCKFQYEQANPMNYNTWLDYIEIIEGKRNPVIVRDAYRRAVMANIPPAKEKKYWRRYIYLLIHYAFYEELHSKDIERAREVYKVCLDVMPRKPFTFVNIWLLYANFETRQRNPDKARNILRTFRATCRKNKLFEGDIDFKIQLEEVKRCRILYEKYLKFCPTNSAAWVQYAELETNVGNVERARDIYKLGVEVPSMKQPHMLWKSYIEFEADQDQFGKARELYQKWLKKINQSS